MNSDTSSAAGSASGWANADPWDAFRQMRDAYLKSMSPLMASMVNTEEYAKATGALLSMYLETMSPVRAWMERVMPHVLAFSGMPSRQEVVSLAGRMTNIEMQLDDIAAVLGEIRQQMRWTGQTEEKSA
jgi:Poly(R)-hydroxyalkanoic acid synthase subunit (PHA_synth_III_E)